MRSMKASLLSAILLLLDGCDRTYAPDRYAEPSASETSRQAPVIPLPMPTPGAWDVAEFFKIPPLLVQGSSTSWFIACTWDRTYFAPGSAEILPETAACLRQITRRLSNAFPTYIHASADWQEAETLDARIELARQRATNVADFLAQYGVWAEAGAPEASAYAHLNRPFDMSAADYNQELRIAIIPISYP